MNESKYTPPDYMELLKHHRLHRPGIGLKAVQDLQSLRAMPSEYIPPKVANHSGNSPTVLKAISQLIKHKLAHFADGKYRITEEGVKYLTMLEVAKCLP